MDQQQKIEIAGRLRDLKRDSSETNESIADAVGVKERTVAGWLSPSNPQGMTYDNAKKVAQLFRVSIDWFWRGRVDGEQPPPDFMERLAALEREVAELRAAAPGELETDLDEAVQQSGSTGKRTAKSKRAARKK